ncbi:hypothetical protein DL98DRAFT_569681 [Cadophora sp. DSE1049]|nr:hypothetical protein DL98DRAFT_569681 [Cadophora sp. DSE1049]
MCGKRIRLPHGEPAQPPRLTCALCAVLEAGSCDILRSHHRIEQQFDFMIFSHPAPPPVPFSTSRPCPSSAQQASACFVSPGEYPFACGLPQYQSRQLQQIRCCLPNRARNQPRIRRILSSRLHHQIKSKGFQSTQLSSLFELKASIEGLRPLSRRDPKCRYLFIHAEDSRDPLKISRRMLDYILTYHQVMPKFLDFVFPFGLQDRLEDFYFSGFREETRLSLPHKGLAIPELGRSGLDFRLLQPEWPWSIRQTALYHSFDVKEGKASWIVVKGNRLIEERVQAATSEPFPGTANPNTFDTMQESFASSLATHLLICDWADEDWRWYLNFLEKSIQEAMDRSLNAFDRQPNVLRQSHERTMTRPSPHGFFRAVANISRNVRVSRSRREEICEGVNTQCTSPQHSSTPIHPSLSSYLQPGMLENGIEEPLNYEEESFSSKDIQRLQYLEEKVSGVIMALRSNIEIITQLKEYYMSMIKSDLLPEESRANFKVDLVQFEKRINFNLADLQSQRSRTEALLKNLDNWKALLSNLMEYQSSSASLASKLLAQKAQSSAERMEMMTKSMHDIAKKTKQDAAAVRIITLVTLVYLPGTFISTLMSTDIVKFQSDTRMFQQGALQLYLALTIPFTVVTFLVWYGMYLWTKHLDRIQEKDNGGARKRRDTPDPSVV